MNKLGDKGSELYQPLVNYKYISKSDVSEQIKIASQKNRLHMHMGTSRNQNTDSLVAKKSQVVRFI